jgi:hypothetical protein
MATHSPIILSDIPKEHVVVLNDSGSTVTPSDLDIQTFGANIHSLYRNSFFLSNHMVGDFAYDKMDEVVNFLVDTNSPLDDAPRMKAVIDLIGEPVIRTKLTAMYNSKIST